MATSDTTTFKLINVFIHVVRRDDGSGGLTQLQIDNWMNLFYNDYVGHHIIIHIIGQSNLNNSTYYNGLTDPNYLPMISTDAHGNAVDIYLLSPNDTFSQASNIPGIALAVGGSYQGTSVLSHEFGHCLGLFHTHSGSGCRDNANCAENIDESNCLTCGDLICDTPADPCLSGEVDVNCQYIGDSRYRPDVHNIMSYAPPLCLNHLTPGQVIRMHSTISSSSIFTTRCFAIIISGPSQVCDQATYTVDNLPAGATVAWSATPTGVVSLQPSGSSVTLTKVSGGNVTLSALINNSVTVTKDIWLGAQASFTGSASVNYLGMGTWNSYVSCTGLYTFQWWLRKANTGVASMCVSNDQELTLRSVAQGSAKLAQSTKPPIVNQPVSYTIFYMFLRVTDASGFQYDTPEQQIYAYGKVDLVPALLLKANNDVQVSDQVKSMEIFPNPASSEVKISINPTSSPSLHVVSSNSSDNTNLNSYFVNVIDVYGSIVYTDTKVEEQFTIPISKLRNGVYNVIVSDGTNTYQNKLIVKH